MSNDRFGLKAAVGIPGAMIAVARNRMRPETGRMVMPMWVSGWYGQTLIERLLQAQKDPDVSRIR